MDDAAQQDTGAVGQLAVTEASPPTELQQRDQFPNPNGKHRWGKPAEFTARYEEYLDTVYHAAADPRLCGRRLLAVEIGEQMGERKARRVLDCAAGTGFPALDLAALPPVKDFVIHCTDNDRPMLQIMADKTTEHYGPAHGVNLADLAPEMSFRPRREFDVQTERFFLDWADLEKLGRPYDYVMCRGNSLVYASSWSGGKTVASRTQAKALLKTIASKVKAGGFLHIDAPRNLRERNQEFTTKISADGHTTVWEKVTTEAEHRHWRLSFKSADEVVQFQRFSTLLTIDDIGRALSSMGFSDTNTVQLPHERPGLGVIIARKHA